MLNGNYDYIYCVNQLKVMIKLYENNAKMHFSSIQWTNIEYEAAATELAMAS